MYLLPITLCIALQSVRSAEILGVFWYPSISHQIVYQSIWRELSLRGHNVTVITTDPLNDPNLTNLTEISVRFTYEFFKKTKIQDVLSKDTSAFRTLQYIFEFMDVITEAEFNSTEVKQLIADQDRHFDLILIECLHPVMFAFSGRFKAPIIGVSSMGAVTALYERTGNPNHAVLFPDILLGYHNTNLSLWQKITSVLFSFWSRYYHYNILTPRADKLAKKVFGDDIPYVGDLERNQSMMFLNLNPLMHQPRPNVPAVVEMGQLHIKPAKALQADLKKLLDEAPQGVIYFSLGSNVKSVEIAEKLRTTIIAALSELPYTVLWKWESDHLPGKPSNVFTRKWLPQQDVLAHRNIRAFVTQGGLQSIEEAISREIPLVGMPFISDQPTNVQKIVEMGIGLGVDPVTVTKDQLKESIIEVAENSKYKRRMKEVRDILFDKPMTGLERAVWWAEYVIRHKGARHLRCPTADVSWFDYLMVDVLLALGGAVLAVVYLIYRVVLLLSSKRKKKIKII